jgi:hypothetical protein
MQNGEANVAFLNTFKPLVQVAFPECQAIPDGTILPYLQQFRLVTAIVLNSYHIKYVHCLWRCSCNALLSFLKGGDKYTHFKLKLKISCCKC